MLHPCALTLAALTLLASAPAFAGAAPSRARSVLEAERQQDIELISRKLQEARARLAERRQAGSAKIAAEPSQPPAETRIVR